MNLKIWKFENLKRMRGECSGIPLFHSSFLILLTSFVFIFSSRTNAQSFKASVRIDTNAIKIGEQFHLTIEALAPKGFKFIFPQVADTISKLEITDRSKIDTAELSDKKLYSYRQTFTVTSFDSGFYAVPPFIFSYQNQGDTTHYIAETEALLISVIGVTVDTTKNIRDIKQPLSAPFTFEEAIPYLLGAAGVALLALLIFYLKKKFKKRVAVIREVFVPVRPPHEIALEELKKLEAERLWQQGLIKQYHSRLTDIVRSYIEHRYGIIAMEMTTGEILESLSRTIINVEVNAKPERLLRLADMVKFAKVRPLAGENEMAMQLSFEFVHATKEEKGEPVKRTTEPLTA